MAGRDDDLVTAPSFLDRCAPAASPILGTEPSAEALSALRVAERIGVPAGPPLRSLNASPPECCNGSK